MAAWTGRPVLALLDAAQIPAVPLTPALHGLAEGFLAALTVAADRSAAAEAGFTRAVQTARQHPDYGYSREFLAGVELAKAELGTIMTMIGGVA